MNWFRFALIALPVLVAAQQPGVVGSASNQPQPASTPGKTQPTPPKDLCSIEGQVLNSLTGEPIRKAHLTLQGTRSPNVANPSTYGGVTDAGGRFAIQDVEPGNYFMTAERNGFTNGQSGGRGPDPSSTPVALTPGQHTSDIVLKLVPHGVIAGRVLDEDGEPVQNVQVNVLHRQFFRGKRQLVPSGQTGTDDLGEYRIFGLAPGKYYLSATYRRWNMMTTQDRTPGGAPEEGYAPTYFPGTTDPAGALAIEVSAGAMLAGTDVTLRKIHTVRIRGRVSNAAGDGLPSHTMLRLMPRNSAFGAFYAQAWTQALRNRGGTFEFRGVAPGAYLVWAQWSEDGQGYSVSQPVDVGNSNLDDVTVLLSPGMELKGQVRSEGPGDVKLGGLHISLEAKETQRGGRGAQTSDDGAFDLQNVSADRYWVNVYGLPPPFYVKSMRMGDVDALESGLDTTQGAAGALEITISGNGGQIEGTAADSKQKPASGAIVVLVPDAPRRERMMLYKAGVADPTGHFTIAGIAPGEYKLFAWEQMEDGAYQDPEFLKPYENQGQAVTIREGSRETAQLKIIPVADTPAKTAAN